MIKLKKLNQVIMKKEITSKEALSVGYQLNIKWDRFDVNQFQRGMTVEMGKEAEGYWEK